MNFFKYILLFSLTIAISILSAQSFVEVSTGITGLAHSSASWGDFDGDRDLDLLINGELSSGTSQTKLYKASGQTFSEEAVNFTGITDGMVSWSDYDLDGDLDILVTGENIEQRTLIYKNEDGNFNLVNVDLGYFGAYSFVCWADYDNDGDPDPFLTGQWQSELYVNNGNDEFEASGQNFMGLSSGRADWADMDGDGDLDLVLTGDTGGGMKLYFYTNDEGVFSETEWGNLGLSAGSVELGDYDSDGDADILISGYDSFLSPAANVYRNDGNTFTNIYAGLAPVAMGNATWGDMDNDGDLDIALTGKLAGCGAFVSEIYENLGNDLFNTINAGLKAAENSFVSWIDFDGDTDLDLLLSGNDYSGSAFTKLYRNDLSLPNFLPEAPQNLNVQMEESHVTLVWDDGFDIQTPAEALTYNLRVGTTSGGYDVISPLSHIDDGQRKINATGNASNSNQWMINELLPGVTYYWSVQTIDNTFAASPFSEEHSFTYTLTNINNRTDNSFALQIFPNPASDYIGVSGLGQANVTIRIANPEGKEILAQKIEGSQKLRVADLHAGLYVVTIEDGQQIAQSKLIIR